MKDSMLIVLAAATLTANTISAAFDLALGGLLIDGEMKPNGGGAALLMVVPIVAYNSAATVTIGGAPTGGTFTLTVANSGGSSTTPGSSQTTTGLAYNATAAAVQAAIQALPNVGPNNATVTGSNGGPYTITYGTSLGTVTTTANAASLTGGAPTITVSVPTYTFQVQTSPDGVNWTNASRAATVAGDSILPAGQVMLIEFASTVRYVQLTLTVSGTSPSITILDAYLSPAVNRFG